MSRGTYRAAEDAFRSVRCTDPECRHLASAHPTGRCGVCACTAYMQPSPAYLAAADAEVRAHQERAKGDAA